MRVRARVQEERRKQALADLREDKLRLVRHSVTHARRASCAWCGARARGAWAR